MRIKQLGKALWLPLLALSIGGCVRTVKYDTPPLQAPFYITFSANGEPLVLDGEGNPLKIEGTAAEIPTPSTIKRATQISALEIHGSHYYLLYINGQFVKIWLPH